MIHDSAVVGDSKALLFGSEPSSRFGTPSVHTPLSTSSPLSLGGLSFGAQFDSNSPLLADTTDLPVLKRPRLPSSHQRAHSVGFHPSAGGVQAVVQSAAYQDWFATHLARITASCNFPTLWVNSKAVQDFIENMLPAAIPVSSYQLAHRYIPQELRKFQENAKERS